MRDQDINNSIQSLGIGAEIYDTVKSFEYDNLTPAANTVCIYYSMLLKHEKWMGRVRKQIDMLYLELSSTFSASKRACSCIASFSLSLSCFCSADTPLLSGVQGWFMLASKFTQAVWRRRPATAHSARMSDRLL